MNDLSGLNQRLGGPRTDQLLVGIAEQLQQLGRGRFILARNRGGEFALLAPGVERQEAQQLAEQLEQMLHSLQQTGASDCTPVAYIGLTHFAPGDAEDELYRTLDSALTQAASQAQPSWAFSELTDQSASVDEGQGWYRLLDQALEQGRIQLYFQPVVATADPACVLHHKVLARVLDEQGVVIPAGRFLPWLERFGWASRLDAVMLELVLKNLQQQPMKVALSLSGSCIREPQALAGLYAQLQNHRALSAYLTLELKTNCRIKPRWKT